MCQTSFRTCFVYHFTFNNKLHESYEINTGEDVSALPHHYHSPTELQLFNGLEGPAELDWIAFTFRLRLKIKDHPCPWEPSLLPLLSPQMGGNVPSPSFEGSLSPALGVHAAVRRRVRLQDLALVGGDDTGCVDSTGCHWAFLPDFPHALQVSLQVTCGPSREEVQASVSWQQHCQSPMFPLTIGRNISHFAKDKTESQRREVILFQVTELLKAGAG